MRVAILIPVLERPQRPAPLVASIAESQGAHDLVPIFLCSPSDADELEAVEATGADRIVMPFEPGRGDYARKLNIGFQYACGQGFPWSFLSGDDVEFRAGWAEAAIRKHEETGACVIGTNDLGNGRVMAGVHSTHTLVHADYAECGTIDEDDVILHEGYHHNYVDEEFIQTAQWRGTFAFAYDSIVEHMHPDWGKGTVDPTYRRGKATFEADRIYYQGRKRLWGR